MSQAATSGSSSGNRKFIYGVAAIAALGGLLFGYDIGIISGAIIYIGNDFTLTPWLKGLVVSSILIGAAVGAGVSGNLADRIGRRRLVLIAAVIFALGAIGMALSPSVGVLIDR